MNVNPLSPSFAWDNRGSIIQIATFAIPLAIESIHFGVKVYHHPGCVKKNLLKAELKVLEGVTPAEGETSRKYKIRVAKNVTRAAAGALCVGGAGMAAYFLAPAGYSIAAALAAIQLSATVYKQIDKFPGRIRNTTHYLKDAFHKRKGESIESFKSRRNKAIKIVLGATLVFATSVGAAVGLGYIGHLLMGAKSVWALQSALPFQTSLIVFLEYAALSAAHTGLAVRAAMKGDKLKALFHSTAAVGGIAFPIHYLLDGGTLRLHHSFLGLALQLVPSRSIQCLGTAITFDSFLNAYLGSQGLDRGQVVINGAKTYVRQYDFQNALVENFPFALKALTSLHLIEKTSDFLTESSK